MFAVAGSRTHTSAAGWTKRVQIVVSRVCAAAAFDNVGGRIAGQLIVEERASNILEAFELVVLFVGCTSLFRWTNKVQIDCHRCGSVGVADGIKTAASVENVSSCATLDEVGEFIAGNNVVLVATDDVLNQL
jgi:hypothetical protein